MDLCVSTHTYVAVHTNIYIAFQLANLCDQPWACKNQPCMYAASSVELYHNLGKTLMNR